MPYILALLLIMITEPERLSARLFMETGDALMGQGLLAQAREAFSRSLDMNPHEHYAVLGLARVSALQGSLDLASSWYRIFMESCPDDYRAPLELGLLLLEEPDSLYRAGVLIRRAHGLEPRGDDVVFAMARLCLTEGDVVGAIGVLEPLCAHDGPHQLEAAMILAGLLAANGDNGGARAVLARELLASHPPALWLAARTHLREGDYMRAVDCANRCLSLNPDPMLADSVRLMIDSLAREGIYLPW
ncbi:MAG: tetratricopeptide repeat protein [Candidatus Fermentibacteraceae bacterium]